MEWLIKDLHEELKAWGHPGGGDNKVIMKSDGERSIVAMGSISEIPWRSSDTGAAAERRKASKRCSGGGRKDTEGIRESNERRHGRQSED